jgi:hypothetical protein
LPFGNNIASASGIHREFEERKEGIQNFLAVTFQVQEIVQRSMASGVPLYPRNRKAPRITSRLS